MARQQININGAVVFFGVISLVLIGLGLKFLSEGNWVLGGILGVIGLGLACFIAGEITHQDLMPGGY